MNKKEIKMIRMIEEMIGCKLNIGYYNGYDWLVSEVWMYKNKEVYIMVEGSEECFDEWDINELCVSLIYYDSLDCIESYKL